MTRRKTTDEERMLFVQHFEDARPLKAPILKPPPPRAKTAVVGPTGLDGRTEERLRKGALDPDARLDLHGLTEAGAHRTLLLFLRTAQMRGCKLALVVTGKGARIAPDAPFDMELQQKTRGVLKSAVPRWLGEREFAGLVASTRAAHRRHGGEGALYVYLRKPR